MVLANNYKGDSAEYTFNYTIRDAQGVTEFTNMLTPYPALRISYSPTTTAKVFLRNLSFFGELTTTSSGLLSVSNHAVYHADNGDGTWDYLINVASSTYWYLFRSCATDPSTLTDGLTTDITTSKDYDLVSPNEDDVTVEGKIYPSDQTDVHYLTSFRYMHLGIDASLDGFMADDTHWSYGFKLVDAIPKDGLGRTMFTREGRNWLAFYIAHNDTYTNMIFGNGSSSSYDGEDLYLGQLAANTWITVTCQNGNVKIFADATQIFSYNVASYWDSQASVNSLNVTFGNGVESNSDQSLTTRFHGLWQGRISDLWIANGVNLIGGQTAVPVEATHHWLLDEIIGKSFAPTIGSVNIEGKLKES